MKSRYIYAALGVAVAGIGLSLLAATPSRAESPFAKLDLAATKVGVPADMLDIKQFCGTKKVKVALSDGWGENSWRKTVRAEFEDEAAKCPNITETRYTDGEGKPEKQIADIQGLIAQHFDIILLYPDGGEALLKVMRQATEAGIAVVPYDIGENKFGTLGKDYLLTTTESQVGIGRVLAEWTVKQKPKGNVVVLGGTPGNPTTAAKSLAGSRCSKRRVGRCSKAARSIPTGIPPRHKKRWPAFWRSIRKSTRC